MTTTMLLIVKHDFLREMLKIWLKRTFPRCQIKAVTTVSEALALVDLPQLIVLDAGLPEASHFEAIKQIRHILPAIPILVLTSYDSEIHRSHALACGATVYFVKDAMATKLQSTIAALLASTSEPNGSEQKGTPARDEGQKLQHEF